MLRNISCILLTACLAIANSSAQICPSIKEALVPCECTEEHDQTGIYCGEDTDLKAVFDRVSLLIDPDFIFDDIYITNQEISELPADTITSLKFSKITFQYNTRLNFIHPEAFNATYGVTTILHLGDNALITNGSHYGLFSFLSKFKAAVEIDINWNLIEYIPSYPFEEILPQLTTLKIGSCYLDLLKVGNGIFANLPALETAHLSGCRIGLDAIAPQTFEGIGSQVDLNLMYSSFTQLPQNTFKTVLDTVSKLRVGGQRCFFGFCIHIPLDCDAVSGWLCGKEAVYAPKLEGFYCEEESDVTIWDWCNEQNNKLIVMPHN